MPGKICVIGSSNVDFTVKTDVLPAKGETVTGGVFQHANGGKGANQAVAAARAGGDVTFVTCLGDDDFAAGLIRDFKKDRIKTNFVFKEKDVPTGVALILVGKSGDNCISVASGANHKLTARHIDRAKEAIDAADYLILQMEIPGKTNEHVLDLAGKSDGKVILNCAPFHPIPKEKLKLIYILVVNENEAAGLSGIKVDGPEDAVKAAEALIRLGVKNAIITLGVNGSVVHDGKKAERIPAFKIKAVDATAAGDTFCGALAVRLTEGASLTGSVRFATAAAALTCTRLGAQSSIPSRSEIDKFLTAR